MSPLNQQKAQETLQGVIARDKAVFVRMDTDIIKDRTEVTYVCNCGTQHTKRYHSLCRGGTAMCVTCTLKLAAVNRVKTLEEAPALRSAAVESASMVLGTLVEESATLIETPEGSRVYYSRALAEFTAKRDNATLLGIFRINADNTRSLITGSMTSRENDLRIRCSCGNEEFVGFRLAYERKNCFCKKCREARKAELLRRRGLGISDSSLVSREHEDDRLKRIEATGQQCIDCKITKEVSCFAKVKRHPNTNDQIYTYKQRCYECSRKLRTSNRHDDVRNASIKDFLQLELTIAQDRVNKYNRRHPEKQRDCTISVDYLFEVYERQSGKCALSGFEMLTTTHIDERPDNLRCNPLKLSIDRVDSNLGYVEGNVQLVCWLPNSMKMDLTDDQFGVWIDALYCKRHEAHVSVPTTRS